MFFSQPHNLSTASQICLEMQESPLLQVRQNFTSIYQRVHFSYGLVL